MTTVYVLFEEQEMKGVFSNPQKALSHRDKLNGRGMIVHIELDSFIHNALSLDVEVLYPGEEPKLREGFNRGNIDMKDLQPKMQEELETLFKSWGQ